MLQRLAPALALLCLAVLPGCGSGYEVDGPVSSPTRVAGPLEVRLSLPKTRYAPGETIPLTLTVRNTGATPIRFVQGGCFPLDVELGRVGTGQTPTSTFWQLSHQGIGCGAVVLMIDFAPGESHTFSFEWNQRDRERGNAPSGAYRARAWFTGYSPDNSLIPPNEQKTATVTEPVLLGIE